MEEQVDQVFVFKMFLVCYLRGLKQYGVYYVEGVQLLLWLLFFMNKVEDFQNFDGRRLISVGGVDGYEYDCVNVLQGYFCFKDFVVLKKLIYKLKSIIFRELVFDFVFFTFFLYFRSF